jgi:hypothetical protein
MEVPDHGSWVQDLVWGHIDWVRILCYSNGAWTLTQLVQEHVSPSTA